MLYLYLMAVNSAFLERKWPRKHRHTLQECLAINPADYLVGREGLPDVEIERLRSGATWRRYLVCPRCERLCGYLFLPPPEPHSESVPEWACRECHGLVYASQRFGRRHPLRLMGPPRTRSKRITGRFLPSWFDDTRRGRKRDRWRGVDLSAFDLLNQHFECNAYGIPVRRVA